MEAGYRRGSGLDFLVAEIDLDAAPVPIDTI
jgi:hypothetical protein